METYNYTIDPVDTDRLTQEIRESAIVTALDHITTLGSSVDIIFKTALSPGDETILNNLVAAHTGEPLPQAPAQVKVTNTVTTSLSSPQNEHSMQAWGAVKGKINAATNGYPITLSNKSVDGLTFNYNNDFPITPRIGDYVFQNDFTKRAWITAVDTVNKTVTFDTEMIKPTMDEGIAHYSKGEWIGIDVPDWYSPMYLWGLGAKLFHTNGHTGKNDFIEFSIVDTNDMFKDDDFCLSVFGVNAATADPIIRAMGFEENGEYGHFTKYYDESWVTNIDTHTIFTPDGAPGEIIPHLEARVSYFTSKQDDTVTEIFLDYFPTAKI